jgi:microcystin-dependent protein
LTTTFNMKYGFIRFSMEQSTPDGWVPCDGREVDKSLPLLGKSFGGKGEMTRIPDLQHDGKGRFLMCVNGGEQSNSPYKKLLGTIRPTTMAADPGRWIVCNGQELEVASHPKLYDLLGNAFGGKAGKTFRVPDLTHLERPYRSGESKRDVIQYQIRLDGGVLPGKRSGMKRWAGYFGSVRLYTGKTVPAGWVFCEGQELSIEKNRPLYSLIGTSYGGDGKSTFRIPDLRWPEARLRNGNGAGPRYMICLEGVYPSRS